VGHPIHLEQVHSLVCFRLSCHEELLVTAPAMSLLVSRKPQVTERGGGGEWCRGIWRYGTNS